MGFEEMFEFPPLGDTGAGEPPYPAATPDDRNRLVWSHRNGRYYVRHQNDRPAVAFRCYYPVGTSLAAAPCDLETMVEFVAWASKR